MLFRSAGKVVVWAGEEALTRLSTTVRVRRSGVFLSSVLARPERLKLPQSWGSVLVAYPYEHPARRAINVSYFRHWIGRAGVPVLDEPLQNEAYFAVSFLSETIAEMLGNLHRDYLIERAETMLGRRESRKAEDEARDAQLLRRYATQHPMTVHGAEGRRLGSREGTTVYPALSLGPGQRFASRGGYVLALASLTSAGPIPRWSVPNQEKSTPINPPPERQTP